MRELVDEVLEERGQAKSPELETNAEKEEAMDELIGSAVEQ